MTSDQLVRPRRHTRLWLALTFVLLIVVLIVVPPLVSIARYKGRINQLVSTALRRPVRLSGVELRVLPRPGFVFTDLTVDEDPAYGAEPVLHANTVSASIRLMPLWRGQLQLSRISVDEASLNLVRAANGRWNIEALFQTAQSLPEGAQNKAIPLPYMEATNSRINVKNGLEKLPFSLVNADASLWQEGGAWRVRLKGQPARTDVNLDLGDTGILRAEARLAQAPRLEEMPLHLDLDWRSAQLGQLTRLVLGSDEGWRGDLTGELHMDGTVDSGKVTARLRAAGVHRAEFAPAATLDFDATCSLAYTQRTRAIQDVLCNTPLGQGKARLTGGMPASGQALLTLELDRVPAQAGMDILRTVRRNLDGSLAASGTVSGKLTYNEQPPRLDGSSAKGRTASLPQPLTGSLVIEALQISGDKLSAPLAVPKVIFQPAAPFAGQPAALSTTVPFPAGGATPVAISARIALQSFQISVRGPSSLSRVQDFIKLGGANGLDGFDQLSGGPVAVDVAAQGAWVPDQVVTLAGLGTKPPGSSDSLTGSIAFRDVTWKPAFLAEPVLLSGATLNFDSGTLRWDPVAFTFGPVKGTGTLKIPGPCAPTEKCQPEFTAHFASLDAAGAQKALLGARGSETMLSSLLARFKPSKDGPSWPNLDGAVQADELLAGPFSFSAVTAAVRLGPAGAEISSFAARVLGGNVNGQANLDLGDKPAYRVQGTFGQVAAQLAGQLVGQRWSGGPIAGSAALTLAGFTAEDLGHSAKGTLKFDWRKGAVAAVAPAPASGAVPAALSRFDRWWGEAAVGDGVITLGANQVERAGHKGQIAGTVTLGIPARADLRQP